VRAGVAWKASNLQRLKRSLDKLSGGAFSTTLWGALQDAYDDFE